jgi:hypothetical protein
VLLDSHFFVSFNRSGGVCRLVQSGYPGPRKPPVNSDFAATGETFSVVAILGGPPCRP